MQPERVARALDLLHPRTHPQLSAQTLGRAGESQRVGDRVRDGLGGDLECALGTQERRHAVAAGLVREGAHCLLLRLIPCPDARPTAQYRNPEGVDDGVAPRRRGEDHVRLELARCGVEGGVQDPGIGATRGQAGLRFGLEQDAAYISARERQCDSASDDAGADDRNLDILPQSC